MLILCVRWKVYRLHELALLCALMNEYSIANKRRHRNGMALKLQDPNSVVHKLDRNDALKYDEAMLNDCEQAEKYDDWHLTSTWSTHATQYGQCN